MQNIVPKPQTSAGEFRAAARHAFLVTGRHSVSHRELETTLGSGGLLLIETPAAGVLHIPASELDCLCLIPIEGEGRFLHDGIETPLRGFTISPAGRGGIFRTSARGAFAVLRIRQSLVRSLPDLETFNPRNNVRIIADAQLPSAFQSQPGARAPILESQTPEDLSKHAATLEAMLILAPPSGTAETQPYSGPRRSNARADLVQCIWEMVRGDITIDRSLEEWCRIVGTSSRTLEYAFTEVAGLSPIAFIRLWRFAQARQLLLQGRVRTVTEAAYGCGLMHLGRFSIDYRLQFGESPSVTLAAHQQRPGASVLAEPSLEIALAKNTVEPDISQPTVTLSSSG